MKIAAVVACVLACPAPVSAEQPFFGVNANRVFNDNPYDQSRWGEHLTLARDSGLRLVRSDAFWEWAEPAPPEDGVHTYDWGLLDQVAAWLSFHELQWLPIVDYSTGWAASVPGDSHSPPASSDDYAAYAAAFAARYGRDGTFWSDYPGLPYEPVTTYEVWNEPNLPHFWKPAPDPARYIELYLAARAAIKQVDPDAVVLVGGLVAGETDYVHAMYEARPEARELVDGIAYHPYAPTPAGVIDNVRGLRSTLEELGEADLPIWITEVGWQTSGKDSVLVVPEETRAAYLAEVADTLARSDCGLAAFIPYTWTTPEANPDDPEDWYGMVHPDATPSPTASAYLEIANGYEEPAERLPVCHPPPPPPPPPSPPAAPPPPPAVPDAGDDAVVHAMVARGRARAGSRRRCRASRGRSGARCRLRRRR